VKQPQGIADGQAADGQDIADGAVASRSRVTQPSDASVALACDLAQDPECDLARDPGSANGVADAASLPMVLMLDDDIAYRADLARYVRSNGFDVLEPDSFAAALDVVQSGHDALVIVPDLTVGSRHLFDYIALLRRTPGISVLVLSSRREETEKIVALELGADDFIAKTADRREILARIRVAARRLLARRFVARQADVGLLQAASGAAGTWRFLRVKRELIDPDGRRVRLTAAEFTLLEAFVTNTGRPLSRDHLSMAALGRHHYATDRGIDNLVAKLRRKLRDSARLASMIKTARPVGYVFTGFSTTVADADPVPGGRRNGMHDQAETTVPLTHVMSS
jgi:DNA-binding response OmpR family regulator